MYKTLAVIDPKKPPRARLEFEVKRSGGIKRETHTVSVGYSLYTASNDLEEYRNISVAQIDPIRAIVTFSNGESLETGEASGNVNEDDIRRIQIRETIESHFDKEEKLFEQGIKCLSLFFIDEVAKYRQYGDDAEEVLGEYGRIFEQEYTAALNERLTMFPTSERQDTETLGETLVHGVNMLTVIASESYAGFVAALQSEIKSDLYERPTKASVQYFEGKTIRYGENGETHTFTLAEATAVYNYLVRNDYVDDNGGVTDIYRTAAETGALAEMKPELVPLAETVHKLIQNIFDPTSLSDLIINGHDTKVKENPLNGNWKDFKELWERINKRYAYTVEFESDDLTFKSITAINAELRVSKLSYTLTTGEQTEYLQYEPRLRRVC